MLVACAVMVFAQAEAEGQAAPAESPVAPQPAPQSQEEIDAINGVINTTTAAERIEAVRQFVIDFPDSEFLPAILQDATTTAQLMNDYDKLLLYGEQTVEADADNFVALIAMAGALAQRTREFDLDKEEKLGRAEEYANRALEVLEGAPRPNAAVTDEQWEADKNDYRADAHAALGFAAMAREDHEKAVEEFGKAVEVGTTHNSTTQLMLARELSVVEQHAEAVEVLDALLASPQTPDQIRQLAESQREYDLSKQQSQ